MTPTLHMSTAGEYSLTPSPTPSTSGATYCGEPHIVDSTCGGGGNGIIQPAAAGRQGARVRACPRPAPRQQPLAASRGQRKRGQPSCSQRLGSRLG
jgi:hypothetical protein